ncbi:MAG TPA: biotin/lipoyl-containing protein, partial [Nevskiaceae bacterium]|nr:biotin/lipoyl-containing protein [Nevskiaceae bacterium]
GIDIFRVFDSLNAVDNMRVAMDAVRDSGALCEGTICYTADLFDTSRPKYNLAYYVKMAKELERAGAHILGIKDMAGVCRPRAARELITALKNEVGLPLHFHTHDTSGISAASVLAAVEAGCDAVDGALDAMSGLTSQPNLSSIAAALAGSERAPEVNLEAMKSLSFYWEGVRRYYAPFEAEMRAGTADVYTHEMPGGQYTNLREQARAMGLDHRWPEISRAYADVNKLFGDIVKVTPTSKVVGDMALYMVANDLTPEMVADPARDIAFPASVISLMRGELGFPPDGFPAALQKKILRGAAPLSGRAGALLPPVDLEAERKAAGDALGYVMDDGDLCSHLMYPKVYREYAAHRSRYGDMSKLPTPVFFYGLKEQQEASIDLEPGKTLVIRLQGRTENPDAGEDKLFFELNGQPRLIRVPRPGAAAKELAKAAEGNPKQVGAPMPGMVVTVAVKPGQRVEKGDALLSIEAMKMETQLRAEHAGTVKRVLVNSGAVVAARDLLVEFE